MGYYSAVLGDYQSYIGGDGNFHFGGAANNFVDFNGTQLVIDTDNFSVDAAGNAAFSGDITAATFTNDELTIDSDGNVDSTGTFRFGGVADNFIDFNGTQLVIDTDNFSVDAAGNATFGGALSAATGSFSGTITASTIIGSEIKTSASGRRVEILESDNSMTFYEASGDAALEFGTTVLLGLDTITTQLYAQSRTDDNAIVAETISGPGAAIFAFSNSSDSDTRAINGWSIVTGIGVRGQGPDYGVYGTSDYFVGTMGYSTAASGVGVKGESTQNIGVNGIGTSADFYAGGSGTNYAPFTGSHDSLTLKTSDFEPGDIMVSDGVFYKNGLSQTIPTLALSQSPLSKASYGIYALHSSFAKMIPAALSNLTPDELSDIEGEYNVAMVNALGEGQINVCSESGDFDIGDFICTSNTAGKGMRYDGQDMRYVVAKCMEPVVWTDEPANIKMVACIYMCG
jgi:hypothetical protein